MAWSYPRIAIREVLFLVTLAGIVQCLGAAPVLAEKAKSRSQGAPSVAAAAQPVRPALPEPAADIREAMLAAVHSGNIEDLQIPLEWNELKPMISSERVDDPISHWKKMSADGEGREILAILGNILDAGHTTLPVGKDIENNLVYVWPAIAEADLSALTPAQEVELYRLVPAAEAKAMREKKTWSWYRVVIGADGTWHSFQKH